MNIFKKVEHSIAIDDNSDEMIAIADHMLKLGYSSIDYDNLSVSERCDYTYISVVKVITSIAEIPTDEEYVDILTFNKFISNGYHDTFTIYIYGTNKQHK